MHADALVAGSAVGRSMSMHQESHLGNQGAARWKES